MTLPILGLHHVTSKSSDPRGTDQFWRLGLGLRRIKQTVNFDNPSVYHLYYGDAAASPGSVMTYFPFPGLARGRRGTGEVSAVAFSVPSGSLDFWQARLGEIGAGQVRPETRFGEAGVSFTAPDGDGFWLIEEGGPQGADETAISGLRGVTLTLVDIGATGEILTEFGYRHAATEGNVARYQLPEAARGDVVDLIADPTAPRVVEGAGSVHHVAFAVSDLQAQDQVRSAMLAMGQNVTGVRDRDYFQSIYFRTTGGVLFEVATQGPGFTVDEDIVHLGETLKLPAQHAHLRGQLEAELVPLDRPGAT